MSIVCMSQMLLVDVTQNIPIQVYILCCILYATYGCSGSDLTYYAKVILLAYILIMDINFTVWSISVGNRTSIILIALRTTQLQIKFSFSNLHLILLSLFNSFV